MLEKMSWFGLKYCSVRQELKKASFLRMKPFFGAQNIFNEEFTF